MAEAKDNTTPLEVPVNTNLTEVHQDVPKPIENDNDEAPPVFKDEVRESIFAKRREQLEKEVSDQTLDTDEESEPASTQPATVIEKVAKSANEPIIHENKNEQEKFILNVYGQERELTRDEIIREAQKGMAASQAFQEAARMKEEALAISHAVRQNMQPQQVAPQNTPQKTESLDKEKMRDIAKRINYGSEEEQTLALSELGANIEAKVRGQTNVLPPEQLVNIATQNAIAVIKNEQEQEILKKEFSDILSDYPLSMATDVIANQLAQKYQQQGQQKTRMELFREAGNMAREKYLKPSVQTAPTVQAAKVDISNDKIERKRAAPKPPVSANKVAVEPPPAYGVGVSSIVNQMRKARGQPIYN